MSRARDRDAVRNRDAVRAGDVPALVAFLRGYLHEDFVQEHGSVAGAVRAFARDAGGRERKALVRDWTRFDGATRALPLRERRRLLGDVLGSAWAPRRSSEIAVLDRRVRALTAGA